MTAGTLLLTVLAAAQADARQPAGRAISLRDAVALAARANPTLGQAIADVAIARAREFEESGIDDFVLDMSSNWQETRRPLVSGLPVQQPAFDDVTLLASLTRRLPTGGRLALRLTTDYVRTESATDIGMGRRFDISERISPSVQLVLSHPLLRGIGPAVARADRRRARVGRDIATLSRDQTAATMLRDISFAYWDLVLATEEFGIRRASATSAREQLRIVRANIGVGKQPPSASAEVEVAIALREDEALFAEQAMAERSLELRRLLALPVGPGEITLAATDRPAPAGDVPPLAQALTAALERNPQLAAARARGRSALIDVDVTENGMLPQLDLTAAGGPTGNSSDLERAFSQLGDLDAYTVQAGLVFQYPLGRHEARGARDAARENLRKVRLSEEEVALLVTSATARFANLVDVARRRVDTLSRTTDVANLDLEAERARFEVGRASNFDVLRRQEEVAQAQLRQVRAKTDYLKAVAALEALTGDILGRYGVVQR